MEKVTISREALDKVQSHLFEQVERHTDGGRLHGAPWSSVDFCIYCKEIMALYDALNITVPE
jgi:hypothetical protein